MIERRHAYPQPNVVRSVKGRLGKIAHREVLEAANRV
jgi:hypothetical protein